MLVPVFTTTKIGAICQVEGKIAEKLVLITQSTTNLPKNSVESQGFNRTKCRNTVQPWCYRWDGLFYIGASVCAK